MEDTNIKKEEVTKKTNKKKKVTVKSVLESTLCYNGLEIEAGSMIVIDADIAKHFIEKGFCVEIKAVEM